MQFIVQVAVEANDAKEAANKIPPEFNVIAVNPRPQQQPQTLSQVLIGGRQSTGQFQHTVTQPTPTVNG